MRAGVLLVLAGLTLGAGGCSGLSAADRGPRGDPIARLTVSAPAPWREDFGDPMLRDLLRQADAGALDTKVALARLAKADAEVEAADAVRGVNVFAGVASAVGGRTFRTAGSAATPTLEISNEVDVWGRIKRSREAARSEQGAATSDAMAVRLQVGALTARTYLAVRAAQADVAATLRRRDLAQRSLDLVRTRFVQGAATSRDVEARRLAVDAARDQALKAADDVRLQAARLGDLTGRSVEVPAPAGPLDLGDRSGPVPSTVVDARPDVRAAQARIAAADQHRASAIAASRPQFQIAAAFGSPDAAIATLLDVRALAWAVAGTVSHQILDGGARRAKVHIATAEADLADLAYRQTVLDAWNEVRVALAADAEARRGLAAASANARLAEGALQVGLTRRAAGAADGLAILALEDAADQARDAASRAHLHVAESRVQLALATGG
ncbi:MAG: TolC family protein [Alphaproteobacteria bacterium]|nr:TolC family protein [Alphaproteobacteria bacterium]MBU1515375.1 TolC family protein [Alphaproteobacteria bacterium]MBU2309935.1 TolC family protein [Alphaproteobacteria bacterium]MBU2363747.1 TolC family protein [Alphaproteobacteria bacterium]